MIDNKNINPEDKKDLKHADIDKFGTKQLNSKKTDNSDLLRREKRAKDRKIRGEESVEVKKSQRIPLGVDILLAVFIILIAASLVVGIYFVVKNNMAGYTSETVEYTVILEDAEGIDMGALKDKQVYCDTDDNTVYMGKITEAEILTDENGDTQIIAKISVDARYGKEEGFSVDENRIAVGCEYALRVADTSFSATIVEMSKGGES